MSFLSLDSTFLFEQYEALRKEALEADPLGRQGHGLTLFLSRGNDGLDGCFKNARDKPGGSL